MQAEIETAGVITQADLTEYRDVTDALRKLRARKDQLRLNLLDAIKRGAWVEGGPRGARVSATTRRPLTEPVLRGLLGGEEVDRLKGLFEPRREERLYVR